MIRFFNVWDVAVDGVSHHMTSQKQIALLAFLALENDRRHSRQALLGLLWPKMGEAEARNNLRVVLAGLRRALQLTRKGNTALIGSNRQEVWFQADHAWVDVVEMARLLTACDKHSHDDRATCAACRQRLVEAATLYRGELLHGFYLSDCLAFDEWLIMQRERHHLQIMAVLGELADFAAGQGAAETAVSHRQRQLELDPLHEEAHRHLLQLWAQHGQINLALNHFEQYQPLLHQALGVAPAANILWLAETLRVRQTSQPIAAKTQPAEEKTAVSPPPPPGLPHYLTPLAGRT